MLTSWSRRLWLLGSRLREALRAAAEEAHRVWIGREIPKPQPPDPEEILRVLRGRDHLEDLVAAAEARLPAPPHASLLRYEIARQRITIPSQVLLLKQQYADLNTRPGWTHFQIMLEGIEADLTRAILDGRKRPSGEDITDQLRFARHFIRMVRGIPEQIARGEQIADDFLKLFGHADGAKAAAEEGFFFLDKEGGFDAFNSVG